MTNRVNWTPLVVFTIGAFALGCLAGILVVSRHGPQSLLAAEPGVPVIPTATDARQDPSTLLRTSTEVEIGEPPALATPALAPAPPPVTPAATRAPARTPPRASTAPAEMVYPVPLPAPVTPSPANIAVIDEDDGVGAPAIASSTGDAVPAAEPSTPAAPPAVRARPAPLEPPERLRRVPPEYPRFARINNIEGTVVIAATIDTDGKVTYPRVVKSLPLLDRAALDAVQQWQFKPGTRAGQPVPVDVTLSVEFSLR